MLLTRPRAAARLGVGLGLFDDLVSAGKIPFVPVGSRRRFAVADLDRFISREKTTWQESTKGRDRRTGGTSSGTNVVSIAEALNERPAAKRKRY
jgi:excisionase family DNA binding protein